MADQNPPPEENDPVADAFAELAAEEAAATGGSPPEAADAPASPQADVPSQANSDADAPAQDDSEPGTEPGTAVSADDAATMAEALLADIGAAVNDVNNGIIGESPSPESQSAPPPPPPSSPASAPPPAPPAPAPIPDGASPMGLPSFDQAVAKPIPAELDMLADVNLNVKIELGRTNMLVEDVLELSDGAVVELDKLAGDPVDIYVNERRVARGEVLVLNDTFCVRINEIIDSEDIKAG